MNTSFDNPFQILGAPISDKHTTEYLHHCGIDSPMILRRGEITAIVENFDAGIELTFKHERALKKRLREYMDGDLVLVNIRMYAQPIGDFKPFKAALPLGVDHSMLANDFEQKLGVPSFRNAALGTVRWDLEDGSLAASFSDAGLLKYVSVLIWP